MINETHTAAFLLVFARSAAWANAAPIVGDRTVPAKIRVIVAAAIALPLSMFSARGSVGFSEMTMLLPYEALFGLLAGGAARLVLAGAEAGGQLIGMQLGLGFAGTFDPVAQEQSLPTRRIAYALAAIAFLSAGGLEEAVRALAMPLPMSTSLLREPTLAMVNGGGQILMVAARLAGPLLVAGIVANVTMAFASKAAPALNVFSVMLAMFLIVGGTVLVIMAPQTARELQVIALEAKNAVWRFMP